MKKLLIAGALALGLAGCETLDGLTTSDPTKEVIAACGAITGALNVLTVNKDQLTPGQIATVDQVVDQSEPVCGAEEPPASGLALVETLATQISSIQIGSN